MYGEPVFNERFFVIQMFTGQDVSDNLLLKSFARTEVNLDALVQYVSTFGMRRPVGLVILEIGMKLSAFVNKRLVALLSPEEGLDERCWCISSEVSCATASSP
jgi:hypothetical protein